MADGLGDIKGICEGAEFRIQETGVARQELQEFRNSWGAETNGGAVNESQIEGETIWISIEEVS
jgi:hypothetical protein